MSNLQDITTKLQTLKSEAETLPQGAMKIFWDTFLNSHNLFYAFAHNSFSFDIFWPTRDIYPDESESNSAGQYMFYNSGPAMAGSLKERLDKYNVKIILDKVTSIKSMFNYGYFTEIPLLDCSTITASDGMSGVFSNTWGRLKYIEGLISSEQTLWSATTFNNAYIEHCPITGTIGAGVFDMHWSNQLDKESLDSIMVALSDTSTGLTATLSLEAVNNAYETSPGAKNGSASPEWTALVAAKPNWTINLL